MSDDKQPTPIGPIMVALRWSFPTPKATRHSPENVRIRRWIERRYGQGGVVDIRYISLRNYWFALDEPARNILETK